MNVYLIDTNNCPETNLNCLENNLKKWYADIADEKKNRIEKITNKERRNLLIFSDHLARTAISESIDIPPEKIVFAHTSLGKPFLPDGKIQFNISHSGNYVACITDKSPCGIDIEIMRDVKLNSAKRFCTQNELEYLNGSSDKNVAFLYIWTRKEAYFKSIGCGIATVLSSVDVLNTTGLSTKIGKDYVLSTYIKP